MYYIPSHDYLLQEPTTRDLIDAVPKLLDILSGSDRNTIDFALWIAVKDLIGIDKKEELEKSITEAAKAEDWGFFRVPFYEHLVRTYPRNASLANAVDDLLLKILPDELSDIAIGA